MGFRAIALGTALGSLVNGLILIGAFERRVGGLVRGVMTTGMAKTLLATLLMAPAAWLAARWLERSWGTSGLLAQLVTGLGPVVVGGLLYLVVTRLLGVPEAASIWGLLRRERPGPQR